MIYSIGIQDIITHYLYVMARITAMFAAAPIYSAATLPIRVRATLAILLTLLITPILPNIASISPFSITGLIVMGMQIIIGLAIGLIFQFVFHIFIVGGQILALQAGLGFATLVDPQSRTNIPMVSQFYNMSITLLFLAINGHLILINIIANSFHTIPIGEQAIDTVNIMTLVSFAKEMFAGAVAIALPAIISLLTVNFTFAVMTKAAPSVNIFSIGFPLTLVLGLGIMYISFPIMATHSEEIFQQGFLLTKHIIGAPP